MFHFKLKPRPPSSTFPVTIGHAVDSSAIISASGNSEKTELLSFFKKAIATEERETVVLHYARCIKSLYQFYKVQRMDDKKAKLVSYLDVLTTEDLQNEEVAELKNLML